MKHTLTSLVLGISLLFGSVGIGSAQDFHKGVDAYDKKDYATALKEWRPLAEQGITDAQYNLGQMYRKGQGVVQDYEEAVKWYRKAAEQGYGRAQNNLGVRYFKGEGVVQDFVRAHMWCNLGGSNGSINGSKSRDLIAKRMTPAQIAEAQKLARECVRKKYKGC